MDEIQKLGAAIFEQIKRFDDQGIEYWSSRELSRILEYTDYRNFVAVINKAKEACVNSGYELSDHFVDVNEMIGLGKGGRRGVDMVKLSRYAGYLIVQNADPSKEVVAIAQTYFAVQTRRAELIEQRLLETERVKARAKLQETEKRLSGVLYERGVDNQGFATIRSKGDQALFRINTSMLKRKYNVPNNRPLADFLPS